MRRKWIDFLPSCLRHARMAGFLQIFEEILNRATPSVVVKEQESTIHVVEEPTKSSVQVEDSIGLQSYSQKGMQDILDFLPQFLDPETWQGQSGPLLEELLSWVAGWAGMVLEDDGDTQKKIEVISQMIPLYRMRGTKKGLEDFLKLYFGIQDVEVRYDEGSFTIHAEQSKIVVRAPDTVTSALPAPVVRDYAVPNAFYLYVKNLAPEKIEQFQEVVRREKPAFARCYLVVDDVQATEPLD